MGYLCIVRKSLCIACMEQGAMGPLVTCYLTVDLFFECFT